MTTNQVHEIYGCIRQVEDHLRKNVISILKESSMSPFQTLIATTEGCSLHVCASGKITFAEGENEFDVNAAAYDNKAGGEGTSIYNPAYIEKGVAKLVTDWKKLKPQIGAGLRQILDENAAIQQAIDKFEV